VGWTAGRPHRRRRPLALPGDGDRHAGFGRRAHGKPARTLGTGPGSWLDAVLDDGTGVIFNPDYRFEHPRLVEGR